MRGSDGALGGAIAQRLTVLRERIDAAADRPEGISVVAVSKRHPVAAIEAAAEVGVVDFGENYAQELADKAGEVQAKHIRWHFVGGLQRNKIKLLAGQVYLWHSIDRLALVRTLADRSPGARLLIQVNTTGEQQKAGCDPDETSSLVDEAASLGLHVAGLMTIGPTEPGADPRPAFARLRELRDQLDHPGLTELSMGMSGDLELAIAEGSTMLRVGTDIFGPRPVP